MRLITCYCLCLLCTLLISCHAPEPFKATDITGSPIGQDFTLTDQQQRPRHLADFKGKAVILFFGYSHCPDICPATLGQLASMMKQLGDQAADVQVIFITLDPSHDTSSELAAYLTRFSPHFLGLTGTETAIAKVTQAYRVIYEKQESTAMPMLSHTAGTYAFDRTGKLRLYFRQGMSAEEMAHDVALLLAGN